MKKITLAAAFALTATTAFAGGLDDPIVEEPVIIEETSSSAGDILIPVLFLIFAAAVST